MKKTTKNIPGDRDLYLAFNTVFKGPNSEVRRPTVIKKLVQQNEKQPEVAQFFKKNNHDAIRDVVYERLKVLLEQQVFKSWIHAKLKFPDLFAKSTAQSAERAASETKAAVKHARAIEGALQGDPKILDDTADGSDETCTHDIVQPGHSSRLVNPQLPSGPPVPLLFPMRLPFITGHKILSEVQALLEQACFDFAKHSMPETLVDRGWDCAEAAELNTWAKILQEKGDHLFQSHELHNKIDSCFYSSLCDIRHAAVHRLPMTAAGLAKCLGDGELLVTLLDDSVAAGRLSEMRGELQCVNAEMEEHKHMFETRLIRTRERIAAERAELDRQEKEAIDGMIEADRRYQESAGANLELKLAIWKTEMMLAQDGSATDMSIEDSVDDDTASETKTEDMLEYFYDFEVPIMDE